MSKKPRPKKKNGRPTKLKPEVTQRIINAIRMGSYIETAAQMAGISKETFYAWLKQGAADRDQKRNTSHRRFSDAVEKAQAESEVRDVGVIDLAAQGRAAQYLKDSTGALVKDADGNPILTMPALKPEWTAAAWRLERKHHTRWGRKLAIEHSGKDGAPISFAQLMAQADEEEEQDSE